MKVLVTGHLGYIGAEMVPILLEHGHDVVGLDTGLYDECDFSRAPEPIEEMRVDLRDVVLVFEDEMAAGGARTTEAFVRTATIRTRTEADEVAVVAEGHVGAAPGPACYGRGVDLGPAPPGAHPP